MFNSVQFNFLPSFRLFLLPIFCTCFLAISGDGQFHDIRCKCICTGRSPSHNDSQSDTRALYISRIDASECNCGDMVLPKLTDSNINPKEYCSLCECKHEYRNTVVMKYAVIFIIIVISLLVIYMIILNLLEYRGIKKISNYQKHVDEDQLKEEPTTTGFEMQRFAAGQVNDLNPVFAQSRNVLDRVGHQQSKWKKQVKEQRKNIYDKHSMLN